MDHNCVLVIPALNPPASFAPYAASLMEAGFDKILVVDDGSRTDKLPVFLKLKRLGCIVLRHEQNQGQGAALKTGFRYYMEHFRDECDGVITLNTDRMVPPGDVLKMASALHNEQRMGSYALVMGVRDFENRRVTDYDYNMNKVMRLLYHMLMGVHLDDPLSGIFGIPGLRIPQCLEVQGDGYAYTTALTMSFEKVGFLQIAIAYSVMDPQAEAKFKKGWDTVKILYTIFKKFILYSITSLSASIVDVILFGIFTGVTFRGNPLAIIYGTVLARVISASVNYLLTKNFVFHFKSDAAQTQAKSAGMFMALSAVQCVLSALSVSLVKFLLGGNVVGIKVLVDIVLFFVSYKLQHKYIFKDDRKKENLPAGGSQKKAAAEKEKTQTACPENSQNQELSAAPVSGLTEEKSEKDEIKVQAKVQNES